MISATYPFFLYEISPVILMFFVYLFTGNLVQRGKVRVNYTRKINHFFIFFLPFLFRGFSPYNTQWWSGVLASFISSVGLLIYIEPIRNRVGFINTMFQSFDRPEDRPYTLFWLSTQTLMSGLALALGSIILTDIGYGSLLLIPIIISGIGDGLAEPVGVYFGKHKYRTFALFSNRKYIRTLEGIACVFLVSFLTIVPYFQILTLYEYITVIILIPIIMTLVEAISPHTWDQPFIYFVGSSLLVFIVELA